MKKWLCVICGLIYDEAEGWPDDGIAPGTRWEDVPEDWTCPDCGVGKEDFEMIEMTEDEPAPVATPTPPPAEPEPLPVAAASDNAVTTASDDAPVVIIGTGYAGYGVADALRRNAPNLNIVMFTADDGANYSKPGLSNAMARERTPDQLVTQTAENMAQRLNATVHTACKVQSIQPETHRLISDQGEMTYSKLVLATGANPIVLPLAGDGAEDVLSVNSLTDYRMFCERLNQLSGKRIGIIGNGLVGCEFANELAARGYQVTVIGLTNWPLDPVLPEQLGRDLQGKLSAMGVNWYLGNSVQSVKKAGAAYGLVLQDGSELEVDLVLSAVGLRPRIELAAAAGINCQRGIVVDEQLQTTAQDVYALGDCTELDGQVLPYIAPITHGLKALAANVLGQSVAVDYPLMPVVVKTPVLPLLLQPPARDQEGEWQVDVLDDGMRALFRDSQQQVRGFALSGGVQQRERQQWLDAIRDAG